MAIVDQEPKSSLPKLTRRTFLKFGVAAVGGGVAALASGLVKPPERAASTTVLRSPENTIISDYNVEGRLCMTDTVANALIKDTQTGQRYVVSGDLAAPGQLTLNRRFLIDTPGYSSIDYQQGSTVVTTAFSGTADGIPVWEIYYSTADSNQPTKISGDSAMLYDVGITPDGKTAYITKRDATGYSKISRLDLFTRSITDLPLLENGSPTRKGTTLTEVVQQPDGTYRSYCQGDGYGYYKVVFYPDHADLVQLNVQDENCTGLYYNKEQDKLLVFDWNMDPITSTGFYVNTADQYQGTVHPKMSFYPSTSTVVIEKAVIDPKNKVALSANAEIINNQAAPRFVLFTDTSKMTDSSTQQEVPTPAALMPNLRSINTSIFCSLNWMLTGTDTYAIVGIYNRPAGTGNGLTRLKMTDIIDTIGGGVTPQVISPPQADPIVVKVNYAVYAGYVANGAPGAPNK